MRFNPCHLLLVFLFVTSVKAQDIDYRPNLIPPSPDACALGKYAEYPISLYTGTIPTIIPLHTVSCGDLQVPITLSYHASGNKVEEAASFTGLGFTLNAGGAVVRSVRNLPDDYPNKGFLDYSTTYSENYLNNDPARFTQWEEIAKGCADAEPDLYYFNFNGYTGSFTFGWDKQLKINSDKPWKIQILHDNNNNPDEITGWIFLGDDGTIYVLNTNEQTTITGSNFPCQTGITYNSAWYMTSMQNPNQTRVINFTYENYTQPVNVLTATTHRIFNGGNNAACLTTPVDPTTNYVQVSYSCMRIQTISNNTNGATVTFNYLNARSDEFGTGVKQLDEISIKNFLDAEIRKYAFTYDYSTGRLTLRSIKKAGTDEPPYKFDYNANALPPRIGNYPTTASFGQDHWGYYNGKVDSPNLLLPAWRPNPADITGAQLFFKGGDRNPDNAKGQAGMLTRITYPAGAIDIFDYFQHEYGYIGTQTVESLGETTTYEGIQADSSLAVEAQGSAEKIDIATPTISGVGDEPTVRVVISMKGFKPPTGDAYIEISEYGTSTVYYKKQFKLQLGPDPGIEDFIYLPRDKKYTLKAYAKGSYTDPHPPGNVYLAYAWAKLYWNKTAKTITPIKKKSAGGVRISQIRKYAYAGDPSPVIKQFVYDDAVGVQNTTSSGVLNEVPFYEVNGLKYYTAGEAQCFYDLRIAQNKAVLGYGPHIGYIKVTELSGGGGSHGKTVYTFLTEKDYPATAFKQAPFQQSSVNTYAPKNSLGESVYKYENNTYTLVNDAAITNFEIQNPISVNGLKFRFEGGINTAAKFTKGVYETKIGEWYPLKSIEKEYASDNINYQQREKDYTYLKKRLRSERLYRNRNAAGYNGVEYYYADDFTNPTPAISSMISKNMIGLPLEVVTLVPLGLSNGVASAVFNSYTLDASSRIHLSEIKKLQTSALIPRANFQYASIKTGGAVDPNYVTETTFDAYDDKDNLLQLTAKNGITSSFLYSTQNNAPVVAAKGVAWDKMLWSSFEPIYPQYYGGSWAVLGGNVPTDFATGKSCYSGPLIISTSSFPATNYILSFWMKGSQPFTLNGLPVPATTNWTFYQTRILGNAGINIDTRSGGLIDEIRFYPEDAQLITTSYDQLVGKNCEADVNSKPTFYEYDNLGRLHLVKDHNRDIVKRINYEYEILTPSSFSITATQTGNYTYQFQVNGGMAGYTYEFDFDDLSTPVSGTASSVSHAFPPLSLNYTVKVKVKNSVNTLA
ncbi:MAG TPA: PKD domain-containing protein, partial [Bacteroidia bacterium]|nr:PKD domain-containing protein [Bacteroidia bacterium]